MWRRRRHAVNRPGTLCWEILPNARGPLIVDACLRIGYTTILLGTLGYFGSGWRRKPGLGTAIKDAAGCCAPHPSGAAPTIALMSFVLGSTCSPTRCANNR